MKEILIIIVICITLVFVSYLSTNLIIQKDSENIKINKCDTNNSIIIINYNYCDSNLNKK